MMQDVQYTPLFQPSKPIPIRRCLRTVLLVLVGAVGVTATWWRFVFLRLGQPDPVASCGDCHCIGPAKCPERPPTQFSKHLIARLRSQVPVNPMNLTCNPYLENDCETVPPPDPALLDLGETAVCAFRYHDAACTHGASYEIITYPSLADALDDGAVPTHAGHCGVCSTAQDLAGYLEFFDLRTHGEYCTKQGLVVGNDNSTVQACFQDTLGFTPACAAIWAANGGHTSKICLKDCWYQALAFRSPENNLQAPACELNSCLQCDEEQSGPIFQQYAGRTRRRAGLLSAIARPCSSLHPEIRHDVCPRD